MAMGDFHEQDLNWSQVENLPLKDCLCIVLNEEWEHRLYGERDLTALEKAN